MDEQEEANRLAEVRSHGSQGEKRSAKNPQKLVSRREWFYGRASRVTLILHSQTTFSFKLPNTKNKVVWLCENRATQEYSNTQTFISQL